MHVKSIAGYLILFGSLPAFAGLDQSSLNTLVARPARPSVEDIFSTAGRQNVLQNQNPMPLVDYSALGGSLLQAYQTTLPRVIAQFEKAYPGAIYLGLGRDSALLSDAINAFYLAQGQTGRSKMIEASGSTFSDNPADEVIVAFMTNYGLDLDRIDKSRPFIIFDGTRFTAQSQSRIILSAIYRVAAKKGIDLKKLVKKINVISTSFDGYQYYPRNLISKTDVNKYFDSAKASVTQNGPRSILSVDGWYLTHGYNWTDAYGTFFSQNGKISSQRGRQMSDQERRYTLAHQIEVIQMTGRKQFLNAVEAESRKLGFKMSDNLKLYSSGGPKADAPVAARKIDFDKELAANIETLATSLKPLGAGNSREYGRYKVGDEKIKLTKNGYDVLTLLIDSNSLQSKTYFMSSTDFLVEQYRKKTIGYRDFKRIFVQILAAKKIDEPKFLERVQRGYKSIPPLEDLLGREKARENFLEAEGILGRNYKALTFGGKLPLSCRFAYDE